MSSSVYSLTGNLFKNSCNLVPLFRRGKCRWLPRTENMSVVGSGQVTVHLIKYMILPGILKMQRTGRGFWVLCPTKYSLRVLTLIPDTNDREEWVRVLSQSLNMRVLYQQQSVPQHPWAPRSHDTKSTEVTKTPQGEGLVPEDCPYFKCWSRVLWSLNTCDPLATKLEVPWPTSKFNNLFEPLTELRKPLYLLSSVIIKHETQGQRNGEEA